MRNLARALLLPGLVGGLVVATRTNVEARDAIEKVAGDHAALVSERDQAVTGWMSAEERRAEAMQSKDDAEVRATLEGMSRDFFERQYQRERDERRRLAAEGAAAERDLAVTEGELALREAELRLERERLAEVEANRDQLEARLAATSASNRTLNDALGTVNQSYNKQLADNEAMRAERDAEQTAHADAAFEVLVARIQQAECDELARSRRDDCRREVAQDLEQMNLRVSFGACLEEGMAPYFSELSLGQHRPTHSIAYGQGAIVMCDSVQRFER